MRTPRGINVPVWCPVNVKAAVVSGTIVLLCSCTALDAPLDPPGDTGASFSAARIDLGTLGGRWSIAADINSTEVVVGSAETASGATHAFRWSASEGMIDLGLLPGDSESEAVAVLDNNEILGFSGSNNRWTPVVWSALGEKRSLPIPLLPGATFGRPTAFNALGKVVGWDVSATEHAWIWSDAAGKLDLTASVPGGSLEGAASAITSSGSVLLTTRTTGCEATVECWRTYLWSTAAGYRSLGTPDGSADVAVTGLGTNDNGTVVGWFARGEIGTTAYRWDVSTGFTLLPHYGSGAYRAGYAMAVSGSGVVVGAEREPISGTYVATVWPTASTIVRLSPEDPNPSVAVAINGHGTIAGWAAISDGANHAMIWKQGSTAVAARSPAAIPLHASVATASSACVANVIALITKQRLTACAIKSARGD